jgi:23S rRNA (cytidine1920-2'-O)/16S rRNA (cytidine1409-2'-O)-methyltransferase
MILAGEVTLSGRLAQQRPTPGMQVRPDVDLSVRPRERYVSRGGEKLAAALVRFDLSVSGAVALDVGASTGGFTDCLLQHGADRVYAVDVGHGQLDSRLRQEPRVTSMERVNVRHGLSLPEKVDLVVADVSFISLRLVLPPAFECLRSGGGAAILLKPQFEARRGEVGEKGVVRDPVIHGRVIGRFASWCVDRGIRVRGLMRSPIEGSTGNREFFMYLEPTQVVQEV